MCICTPDYTNKETIIYGDKLTHCGLKETLGITDSAHWLNIIWRTLVVIFVLSTPIISTNMPELNQNWSNAGNIIWFQASTGILLDIYKDRSYIIDHNQRFSTLCTITNHSYHHVQKKCQTVKPRLSEKNMEFGLNILEYQSRYNYQLTHCGLVMPWWHRSGLTLAQVMACCLTAPSHYLNQCWPVISKLQRHSSEAGFTRDTSAINH